MQSPHGANPVEYFKPFISSAHHPPPLPPLNLSIARLLTF